MGVFLKLVLKCSESWEANHDIKEIVAPLVLAVVSVNTLDCSYYFISNQEKHQTSLQGL